jgi:hypothetical protein
LRRCSARGAVPCRGLVTGGRTGRRLARCADLRRMQRFRQPAEPTFTIGSSPLHRADGSSHAERLCGCSSQKGPLLPWITPTPSVRPTTSPTPRLTHRPAGPPVRRAPSAAAVPAVASAAAGVGRAAAPKATEQRTGRRGRRPQRHRAARADARGTALRRGGRASPGAQTTDRRHHADADHPASRSSIQAIGR